MGHIWADALFEGSKGRKVVKTFVDTGSTYAMLPYSLAEELGAWRLGRLELLELADGRVREFEVAYIDIEVLGRRSVGAKVYLTEAKEPSLGAFTLEELGLEVDPVFEEVRPSRSWRARAPSWC